LMDDTSTYAVFKQQSWSKVLFPFGNSLFRRCGRVVITVII
jgi:hypothetical protein